jgi:hypothetical protein
MKIFEVFSLEFDGILSAKERRALEIMAWRQARLSWNVRPFGYMPLVGLIIIMGVFVMPEPYGPWHYGIMAASLAGPMGGMLLLDRFTLPIRNRWIAEELVRRGVRPKACMNCHCDLQGAPSDACPECGTQLAPCTGKTDPPPLDNE